MVDIGASVRRTQLETRGRLVAFMPTTARFAGQARALGLHAVKIGAAPVFRSKQLGAAGGGSRQESARRSSKSGTSGRR